MSLSLHQALPLLFCKALNANLFSAQIDTFPIPVGTGALPHNYHLVLQLNVQTVHQQQLYLTQWLYSGRQTWRCSGWVCWASWQSPPSRCPSDLEAQQRSSIIWKFLKPTGSLHRYLYIFLSVGGLSCSCIYSSKCRVRIFFNGSFVVHMLPISCL